jgi:hypothetical protein
MCQLHAFAPQGALGIPRAPIPPAQAISLKFWEIEHFFRCPIIGMCLTAAEQRQLLKKCGFDPKSKNPYEIHEILVAGAESENRMSQRVDRLLHRKFGLRSAVMGVFPEEELLHRWRGAFQSGDYRAEFWAVASRRDLSIDARKEIFGAIHMAMHASAEQSAHAAFRLNMLQSKVAEQEEKLKAIALDRRTLRKENEALRRALADQQARMRETERDKDRRQKQPADMLPASSVAALEQENQRLSTILLEQADKLRSKERKQLSLVEEVSRLTGELEAQQQAEVALRKETQETLRTFMEMNRCDADCPSFNLCSKRVLIVGGIARMEALYRQLIETSGGVFEYHDGYMNGGAKQLENSLRRSDIVLCPVNCNSHAACAMVKNLGKKHNKPVHMLPSFSLSTVSQIIRTCGAGPAAAN